MSSFHASPALTTSSGTAPLAGPGTLDRAPEVVELKSATQPREPASSAGWSCASCDLAATGFSAGEAAYLAKIHDQVMHWSAPTAMIHLGLPVPGQVARELGELPELAETA